MVYTLVLNSSNVIGSTNSIFKYTFTNGGFEVGEDAEICLSQLTIPYSWFNLSKTYYNNTTIQYTFPNGSTTNIYTVVLPDGFYSVLDINNYLALYMVSQNQYFYNSTTGNNLYFIQISTNTTYYSNQIIANNVPTTLPTGYSVPSTTINGYTYTGFNCNTTTAGNTGGSSSFYPTTTKTTQVIIPSYTGIYGIGSVLGFLGGSYPSTPASSSYNVLSNTTPLATPVNSLVIRCDIVSNPCSPISDILDSCSINVTFGSNLNYAPSYEKWVGLKQGTYNSMVVSICDQNFNVIPSNDPNVLISILIRSGKKKEPKLVPPPLVRQIGTIPFKFEDQTEEQ